MLIATRALLGVAGATLAPSTLSLIRNMFHDPGERTFAIGVWVTSYSVGGAIGPLIGGLLLQWFWWGSVFLIGVPVMVLLLVLGPVLLPEFRDPDAGRLDLPSVALSLIAVLATINGLKHIAEHGPAWLPALSIVAGVVLAVLFLRRQRTLADPLIDLRLFRVPAFSASLATYTLGCFVMFGVYIFIAQYLQLVLGLSPLQAGLWTVSWALAFVVGSMLTPAIVRWVSPASAIAAGLALTTLGFALITQVGGAAGLAIIVTGTVILSLGLAPVFPLATDLVVGAAPPERAGGAAAISETSAEFGGALGIAIFGSIGTVVYRSVMASAAPAGVSHDVAQAAQSTLGAAVAMAEQLPANVGPALLDAARAAFVDGLQLTAVICAVLVMTTAILAAVMLRSARPRAEPDDQQTASPVDVTRNPVVDARRRSS